MSSSLTHLDLIPKILIQKGIGRVIICPGSRNAPLTQVFYRAVPDKCQSLVDERSAAYFAMGYALKTGLPSVVITTSGTATLNLAPAVAEAYFLGVPMIVITADRPTEWIGQQDNQAIDQANIFANNCKASRSLPVSSYDNNDLWYVNRLINEAYLLSMQDKPGPVHINVPLREPLYEEIPQLNAVRLINVEESGKYTLSSSLKEEVKKYARILIVCGQHVPNSKLGMEMKRLSETPGVVVLSESISNISGPEILTNYDLLLQAKSNKLPEPELVIYFGGQVISKALKSYLRAIKDASFWFVSPDTEPVDTFQNLNKIIKSTPEMFFQALSIDSPQTDFKQIWVENYKAVQNQIEAVASGIDYSDLWCFRELARTIGSDDIVFAGNSSVVRYLQIFSVSRKAFYANRGTSGIDGCVSTASGVATATKHKVFALVGDLSFVYDSNGLWNKDLPSNLKIIVINNGGGGIFSMIPGPPSMDTFEEFFETNHPVSIENICSAFGVNYIQSTSKESLVAGFSELAKSEVVSLLEIKTKREINNSVFSSFKQKLLKDE